MALRGARCLAQWLPRLAHPLAQCPSAQRRRLGTQDKAGFVGSDRTYGARRVWHDVLAEGAACGLHRVERLMREQALRARPRRRGLVRPGRPADSSQRAGSAVRGDGAEPEMDCRLHLSLDGRGFPSRCCRHRPVLAARRRLVDERHDTAQLVADALMMAIWRRGKPDTLSITRIRAANTAVSSFRSYWPIMASAAA